MLSRIPLCVTRSMCIEHLISICLFVCLGCWYVVYKVQLWIWDLLILAGASASAIPVCARCHCQIDAVLALNPQSTHHIIITHAAVHLLPPFSLWIQSCSLHTFCGNYNVFNLDDNAEVSTICSWPATWLILSSAAEALPAGKSVAVRPTTERGPTVMEITLRQSRRGIFSLRRIQMQGKAAKTRNNQARASIGMIRACNRIKGVQSSAFGELHLKRSIRSVYCRSVTVGSAAVELVLKSDPFHMILIANLPCLAFRGAACRK